MGSEVVRTRMLSVNWTVQYSWEHLRQSGPLMVGLSGFNREMVLGYSEFRWPPLPIPSRRGLLFSTLTPSRPTRLLYLRCFRRLPCRNAVLDLDGAYSETRLYRGNHTLARTDAFYTFTYYYKISRRGYGDSDVGEGGGNRKTTAKTTQNSNPQQGNYSCRYCSRQKDLNVPRKWRLNGK